MPNNVTNQPMFIQSGDPETENIYPASSDPYPGMLGTRVTVRETGPGGPPGTTDASAAQRFKTYQRVQTDSTMTVTPFAGAVAWWANQARYLVTTSPTALGRGRVAGRFCNAITAGGIGFVQTKGPGKIKYTDAVTSEPDATGKAVIPSATAGKADCLAAGAAPTYPALGRSISTRDVNSEGYVDLDVAEVP